MEYSESSPWKHLVFLFNSNMGSEELKALWKLIKENPWLWGYRAYWQCSSVYLQKAGAYVFICSCSVLDSVAYLIRLQQDFFLCCTEVWVSSALHVCSVPFLFRSAPFRARTFRSWSSSRVSVRWADQSALLLARGTGGREGGSVLCEWCCHLLGWAGFPGCVCISPFS